VRALVLVTLLASLAAASPCAAQQWSLLVTGADQSQVQVDTTSIKQNGGYIVSWTRVVYPTDKRTEKTHKPYRIQTTQRLDNCVDHTFTIVNATSTDAKGVAVDTVSVPSNQWQFYSLPPGTVGGLVQSKICAIASYRASLQAAVPDTPATQTQWQFMSFDPTDQEDYYLDPASVRVLKGAVGYIMKVVERAPKTTNDGDHYGVQMLVYVGDCANSRFGLLAMDRYDSAGNLVDSLKITPQQLQMLPAGPGSNADLQLKTVCKAGQAPPSGETAGAALVSGTAWMGPKGYVITAAHVVDGARDLRLYQDGKPVGRADVVAADPANDIAILRPAFSGGQHLAMPLDPDVARLGERVFTLGYPAVDMMGLSLKMTSGEVSALAGNDAQSERVDDVRLLQISVPIQPGNSGGPVIDAEGKVVGIVISSLERLSDTQVAQNVNYALKIAYVRTLITQLPALSPTPFAPPTRSIEDAAAELKDSVFLVVGRQEHPEQ
jgi:S1-C subfamily serine protease